MKNVLFTVLNFVCFSNLLWSQNAYLNKQDRTFFSNEIFASCNGFWYLEAYSLGLGYERTIYKLKNKKKDYLTLQNDLQFFIFRNEALSIENTLLNSVVKYNRLNKYSIYSFGVGDALTYKSYFNPLLYGGYKYYIKRHKLTIGIYAEVFYDWQNTQKDTIPHYLSPYGANSTRSNTWNFWGGITIGKYF